MEYVLTQQNTKEYVGVDLEIAKDKACFQMFIDCNKLFFTL